MFRFSITCVFTALYTYVTEVYPTSIRSLGMGINLFFARLATVVVAVTADKYDAYWAFCAIGIVVFVVHSQLKETFGKPLEDEIEELIWIKRNEINLDKIGFVSIRKVIGDKYLK